MKVVFFIGSPDISGGTYVIYQHAMFAQQMGHDVTIAMLYPPGANHIHWHPSMRLLRFVPAPELGSQHFDLAVATWWRTAAELHQVRADKYAYFVQSIESRFYPEAEAPLRSLVDSTYELGLPVVTEATWIQQHLRDLYGSSPLLVRNGIRKDLYSADGMREAPQLRNGLRILVEGPLGVFFKNVGNSLRLSRRSRADETWLLTSTAVTRYPGVKRVYSRIPITSVPSIYRSCDLILKLSYVEGMFGPPLEMFHCGGTAIVYAVTGHDEYIRDGVNALVLQRDDEQGVIEAINRLRDEPSALADLKRGATKTAREWPTWDESSTAFEQSLRAFAEAPAQVTRSELRERNEAFMAEYVEKEQQRLAALPPVHRSVYSKVMDHAGRFERIAAMRRWMSLVREGWGPRR